MNARPLSDDIRAARLSVTVSDELVEAVAAKAAAIVLERIAAPASPYLSVQEAAAYLRASRQRVYDLLSDGRLTRFRDGSRVLIARSELEAYLGGDVAPALPRAHGSRMAERISP